MRCQHGHTVGHSCSRCYGRIAQAAALRCDHGRRIGHSCSRCHEETAQPPATLPLPSTMGEGLSQRFAALSVDHPLPPLPIGFSENDIRSIQSTRGLVRIGNIFARPEPRTIRLPELSAGLEAYAPGTTGYRAQLTYLVEVGTRAIQAVRRSLHHGVANMAGPATATGHKRNREGQRQLQGHYRGTAVSDLATTSYPSRTDVEWLDEAGWNAASAVTMKAGICAAYAGCVFMWCMMNARCRVSIVEKRGFDHTWCLLTLGTVHVVVDAWVTRPALCFPEECSWYDSGGAQTSLRDVMTADVVGPNDDIMRPYMRDVGRERAAVKEELKSLKGEGHPAPWNDPVSIRQGVATQLGQRLTHGVSYVPLADPHRMMGRGIIPLSRERDSPPQRFPTVDTSRPMVRRPMPPGALGFPIASGGPPPVGARSNIVPTPFVPGPMPPPFVSYIPAGPSNVPPGTRDNPLPYRPGDVTNSGTGGLYVMTQRGNVLRIAPGQTRRL